MASFRDFSKFKFLRKLVGSKSVSINSFWNTTGFILISLCNFAASPISYAKLGRIEYGIWIFIVSTMQYSSVLYFGFGSTIITYVAELSAKKDYLGFNKLISLFFTIYSGLGFATFIFSLIVSIFLPKLIGTEAASQWSYRLPVIITGVQMGISFPCSVFGAILMGSQNYFFLNISNFLVNFLNFLFILLVPIRFCTLLTLSSTLFVTGLVGLIVNYMYIKRIHPTLRISMRNFDRAQAKSLFTFSFKSFVMLIADKIIALSDTFVIGIFLGPSAVALYSVPQRLVQYLQIMTQSASGVLFPKFSELRATGQSNKLATYWLTGYKLSLALSMPATLLFFFYGDIIQTLWMGKDFSEGHSLLIILTAAYVFQQSVTRSFLVATDNHSLPSKLLLLEAVANLGLTLIFVKYWGLMGVSIGTFIPCFLISSVAIPIYACRLLKISTMTLIGRGIFPNLAASLLPAVLLWWLRSVHFGTSLLTFIITATCASGLFFILFFVFDRVKKAPKLNVNGPLSPDSN